MQRAFRALVENQHELIDTKMFIGVAFWASHGIPPSYELVVSGKKSTPYLRFVAHDSPSLGKFM